MSSQAPDHTTVIDTLLLTETQRARAANILRATALELEHTPEPSYAIVVGNLRSVLIWLEDCLRQPAVNCPADIPLSPELRGGNGGTHTGRLAGGES